MEGCLKHTEIWTNRSEKLPNIHRGAWISNGQIMSPQTMVTEKRGGVNFMESVRSVATNSSSLYPKCVLYLCQLRISDYGY